MGVLGYNQYTAISNDTLKGEFPFKPFEGYTNKETVAKYTLKTTKEEPKATQHSTPSTNLNDSKVQDLTGLTNGTSDGASLQQKEEGRSQLLPVVLHACPNGSGVGLSPPLGERP